MKRQFITMVSAMLTALAAFSSAQAEPHCTPTTQVSAPNYPGARNIPSTNNLLLPTGKAVEAEAQRLIISGQVVDTRCIPVQDAMVELWQMSPFGKWTLVDSAEIVTPNPVFAGAGRTVTDGEGYFTFTTGFPGVTTNTSYVGGKKGKKKTKVVTPNAPRVYVRIKAEGFAPFTTALFFEQDRRNADDVVYKKLSDSTRAGVTLSMGQDSNDQVVGSKQIVLPGKTPYRTY